MNLTQSELWNGRAGRAWVDEQEALDRMFQPFEDLLIAAAALAPASRVLDVGCGTGATTIAAARRIGPEGRCVGIDLSAPMLDVARVRAGREGVRATFIQADAQKHAFEPASFDRIISRFGVMFFEDPAAAFANLRSAATTGAQLRFAAWRSPAENPFMTTAERAAAPLLPQLPPRQPNAPGQFAFADQRRVSEMLRASGWVDVEIRAIDVPCTLAESELTPYLTRLGPVAAALQELDDAKRSEVVRAVRAAFASFVQGSQVRYLAACWMVSARCA